MDTKSIDQKDRPEVSHGGKGGQYFKLSKDDLERAETLSGIGLTLEEIGLVLGVSRRTMDRLKKRDPEFRDALARGKAKVHAQLAARANKRAMQDDRMLQFVLKCHHGWTEKQHIDITGDVVFQTQIGQDGVIRTEQKDAHELEDGNTIEGEIVEEKEDKHDRIIDAAYADLKDDDAEPDDTDAGASQS